MLVCYHACHFLILVVVNLDIKVAISGLIIIIGGRWVVYEEVRGHSMFLSPSDTTLHLSCLWRFVLEGYFLNYISLVLQLKRLPLHCPHLSHLSCTKNVLETFTRSGLIPNFF